MQQISHVGLKEATAQARISMRCAHNWHRCWRELGADELHDCSSRPTLNRSQTRQDKRERIIQLRRNYHLPYVGIAHRTSVSLSTVGHICIKAGATRLPSIQTMPSKHRYERKTLAAILLMDMKKLAGFQRRGHCVTGNLNQLSRAPEYHTLHVGIDDHSRVGFSKILPDDNSKCHGLHALRLTLLPYSRRRGTGIRTDNGSA